MGYTVKALVVRSPGSLALEDTHDPQLGPYDALVKMESCGFCNSTDLKLIDGLMDWAPPFPILLGHESVGTIVEIGRRVRKYAMGDMVTRPVAWFEAANGDPNSAFGGFAELGVVRDATAMAHDGDERFIADYNALRQNIVPPELDAVQAALCISLAETASSLAYMPRLRGQKVVIAGTGIAGLSYTLWASMEGAEVLTVGRRQERLDIAMQLGAAHTVDSRSHPGPANTLSTAIPEVFGGKADIVIDAIGDVQLAASLEEVVQPAGTLIAYGVPTTGNTYSSRWETARVEEHEAYPWVARMVSSGLVNLSAFLSHTWRFADMERLIPEVEARRVLKAVVRF
jgi:threonine dehydrogenase-like Zn-dependent dehydrogenase